MLSRPRHCKKGAQPVPKAVHRSGCRDKHNWPRPLTPQSITVLIFSLCCQKVPLQSVNFSHFQHAYLCDFLDNVHEEMFVLMSNWQLPILPVLLCLEGVAFHL